MSVQKYEVIYIIDPALPEEEQTALIERWQRLVTDQGGTVDAVDKWERRRLAYEIKGKREGIYVVMNFSAESPVATELDRLLRLTDSVIRHMIVGVEEKKTKKQVVKETAETEPEVAVTS